MNNNLENNQTRESTPLPHREGLGGGSLGQGSGSAEVAESALVPKKHLVTFVLITSLFALRGFAHDITNPMVAAFQTVMELSAAKASMVQFAFYGSYATMAVPAALFIRRYSYKRGILLGLALYAIGAFLFIPAAQQQSFLFFFMSLMFPTIYGIALENVDAQDTTLGAAFLVMAIVGGALMPPLQGMIIDQQTICGHPAVNVSYVLPFVCFLIIMVYGWRSCNKVTR